MLGSVLLLDYVYGEVAVAKGSRIEGQDGVLEKGYGLRIEKVVPLLHVFERAKGQKSGRVRLAFILITLTLEAAVYVQGSTLLVLAKRNVKVYDVLREIRVSLEVGLN